MCKTLPEYEARLAAPEIHTQRLHPVIVAATAWCRHEPCQHGANHVTFKGCKGALLLRVCRGQPTLLLLLLKWLQLWRFLARWGYGWLVRCTKGLLQLLELLAPLHLLLPQLQKLLLAGCDARFAGGTLPIHWCAQLLPGRHRQLLQRLLLLLLKLLRSVITAAAAAGVCA